MVDMIVFRHDSPGLLTMPRAMADAGLISGLALMGGAAQVKSTVVEMVGFGGWKMGKTFKLYMVNDG